MSTKNSAHLPSLVNAERPRSATGSGTDTFGVALYPPVFASRRSRRVPCFVGDRRRIEQPIVAR